MSILGYTARAWMVVNTDLRGQGNSSSSAKQAYSQGTWSARDAMNILGYAARAFIVVNKRPL